MAGGKAAAGAAEKYEEDLAGGQEAVGLAESLFGEVGKSLMEKVEEAGDVVLFL